MKETKIISCPMNCADKSACAECMKLRELPNVPEKIQQLEKLLIKYQNTFGKKDKMDILKDVNKIVGMKKPTVWFLWGHAMKLIKKIKGKNYKLPE